MEELKKILKEMGLTISESTIPIWDKVIEVEIKGYNYIFFKDGTVVRRRDYKWEIKDGKLDVK